VRAARPGESALLLLDVVEVLERHSVAYAVIGAMAAAIYGVVRASMDADAIVSLPPHELGDLGREYRAAGFRTELRDGEPGDPIGAVLVISDSHGNRVDLLAGLRGLDSAAFTRAIEVSFQTRALRFIGREDFIAMKLFAHGPQDLADAGYALAASEAIDFELLRRLTAGFGPDTVVALAKLRS